VSWIVETAELCGNKVTTSLAPEPTSDTTPDTETAPSPGAGLPSGDPPTKQGRFKGKARKGAKEAAKPNVPKQGVEGDREAVYSSRPPCHQVTTAEILRQATFLESISASVVIPRRIWRALGSAIKGRRKYVDKFAKQSPEHPENASHVYFVDLLQDLANRFSRCMPIGEATSTRKDDAKEHTAFSVNRFDTLYTVDQDPGDDIDTTASSEGNEEPSASSRRYEPLVDPKEEASLYVMCLYEDWEEMTNYVIGLWDERFSTTDVGLDIASVAFRTDAAFSLVEETELEALTKAYSVCPDEVENPALITPVLRD
jgi:hypothetical protein